MQKQRLYKISSALLIVMLTLVALPVTPAYAASCTFTSTGTAAWSLNSTWTITGAGCASVTAYPGSDAANTDTVVILTGHTVTLDVSPANPIASLTINAMAAAGTNGLVAGANTLTTGSIAIAGSATAGRFSTVSVSTGTINSTGNITFSGTAAQARLTFTGAGNLNIGGNLLAGGTFAASASTVNFNGAAQTVGAYTYFNLSTSGSNTKTTVGVVTVNGDLTVGAGTTFDIVNTISVTGGTSISGTLQISNTAGTKTFIGSVTINNPGGVWNSTIGEPVTFQNGLTHNGASFTAPGGAIIYTFNTNNQAIGGTSAISIPNLTVTGVNLTNNGTLTVGTALAGTGTLTQGIGAILNIGATAANFTLGTLDATANPNTVNYSGAAQTVKVTPYHHLTLSGSGAKTIGAITVNGVLSREGTATASAAPTYGAGAALQYKGSAAQTTGPEFITPFTATGGVIIDNALGVTLGASKTINSTLTFTNGRLITGANTLTMGLTGTVAGAGAGKYVFGNLQRPFPVGAGQSYTFEIGDASIYAPMALANFDVTAGGNVTATTTAGEHPVIINSAIDSSKDVNRYWTLTSAGGLVFTTADATFNFVAGDVDGGATTSNFIVKEYVTPTWFSTTTGSQAATSTQATGLTAMGDFAVGEPLAAGVPILTLPGANPVSVNENAFVILDGTAAVIDASPNFNTGVLDAQVTNNAYAGDELQVLDDACAVLADIIDIVGTDVRRCTFPTFVSIGTLAGNNTAHLTVTFNANATPAYVQDVVRHLRFTPTNNNTSNLQRTVTFTLSDGVDGTSLPATKLVNVTPVNDQPNLAAWSGPLAYTENAAATVIDANVTLSDPEVILQTGTDRNLTTGSMTVSFIANGSVDDRLAIRNQGVAAGQIGVSGANVTYGGVTIGTFSGGTDGSTPLVITFNGSVTNAAAQALARNITYRNVSDNPSTLARSVRMQVTDGLLTDQMAATINVTAVDDAPVAVDDSATVLEDAAATDIPVMVLDTDVDGGLMSIISVTQPANGTVIITGGGTGLTYQPTVNTCNNGIPTDDFTYTLNGASSATVAMTVTCVNDAPSFTAVNPPTVFENAGGQSIAGWATFSPGPVNESAQTVLAYIVNGISNPGLFLVPPSVNAAGTLTYTPAASTIGTSTFDVTVQDNGGTNNSGVDTSSPQTFTITVIDVAPTVTTQAVTSIGTTTATGNGTVTDLGAPNPTQHGVVWNTTGTPTTADSFTADGPVAATGAFTSSMTGLSPNTTYYVRAYATNAAGTSYGNEVTFTTLQLPSVTTQAVTSIGTTTATGNGTVTDLGAPNPTQHGVVWNTTGTPTTADSFTADGPVAATGAFTSSMTGLSPNTTYYVRAYATNTAGTSYGNEVTFTTLQLPSVTTQAVTSIGTTTATGNGTVTDLGAPNPTQHGVVWNTTGTPTTADSFTADGPVAATGAFTSSITGLTPNTLYHVRAYATNAAGTSYGNEVTFTALLAPTITSAPNATFSLGLPGTFTVTASGTPAPTLSLTAGTLPTGVTFIPATGILAGTPGPLTTGDYNLTFTASNGVSPDATQNFTLTVKNGPTIGANGINSVPNTGNNSISENEIILDTLGITQIIVQFSQDVYDDPTNTVNYADDVTNPANFKLVLGSDMGVFATVDCLGGVVAPDIAILVDTVTYSNGGGSGPFLATLSINGGFPLNAAGFYRLYVCGTTSVVDALDINLALAGNGTTPGTDFVRNFRIQAAAAAGAGSGNGNGQQINISKAILPSTGFAPDRITILPVQPADKAYKPINKLSIEIPTLGIKFPIVGALFAGNSWDLTWLMNNVAYLEGSAYPTLAGNTVLTAHVTDANNNLGPFSDIKGMQLGQRIYIHANDLIYVYQVQENKKILPSNIAAVFKHEEYDWITLVTCEDYNTKSGLYRYRRMVRAVLISVIDE